MNLSFSKCDQTLKLLIRVALLSLLPYAYSTGAHASPCTPFLLYKNMLHPVPDRNLQPSNISTATWIEKISKTPGHENFAAIYKRFKPHFTSQQKEAEYLSCVFSYTQLDHDGDGIKDWKIVSHHQLHSHLLPNDEDWDNDGVANIFDSHPLTKNKKSASLIPSHLQLSSIKNARLNALQKEIYATCHVLAVNHTDAHSVPLLETFLEVCKPTLASFKNKPYNFVLYAFASHSTKGDVVASFYAESNFMSIGGTLSSKNDLDKLRMTLAHEIGHYFTFNYLTPKELAIAAARFGHWHVDTESSSSFFDAQFLKPSQQTTGFFPSIYARTNIHEWFSEVFASITHKKNLRAQSLLAINTPDEMELWFDEHLPIGSSKMDPSK